MDMIDREADGSDSLEGLFYATLSLEEQAQVLYFSVFTVTILMKF
jgi:hypothetical protein